MEEDWSPCLQTLEGHRSSVPSIAWSLDGNRLASASFDMTVRIWDPATGQCISTFEGHTKYIWSISWSLDGDRLASGSDDNTVRIWDPATGQCTSTLTEHSDWVWSIAWSQDGSRLACGSHDKTVRIWDIATKQCTATIDVASPGGLEFDKFHLNRLHTSVGTLNLEPAVFVTSSPDCSVSLPQQVGYGLNNNSTWITYGGEDLLRLPSEHRPVSLSSFAIFATTVAIGCSSGRVLILKFSEDSPIS